MRGLKFKWMRLLVRWRQWQDSIGDTMKVEKIPITAYEEKAIKLWKVCLKDAESVLSYNTQGVRQIEKENLFIIFQPSGNLYHIMTIMDVNESGKTLFEIHIPKKEAEEISSLFDIELEKRMRRVEDSKRSIIEGDLDKLLKQQQAAVKK